MRKWIVLVALALSLIALVKCNPITEADDMRETTTDVTFNIVLGEAPDGQLTAEFLLKNNSAARLPRDDAFDSTWELSNADGEVRMSGVVNRITGIEAGDEETLATWTSELESGSYVLSWGAPDYGASVVTFDVEKRGPRLFIGRQTIKTGLDFPPPIDI